MPRARAGRRRPDPSVAHALTLLALTACLASCATAEDLCEDTCQRPGVEAICEGNAVSTCTMFADGCQYWGQPAPCADGLVCVERSDGTASCQGGDECQVLECEVGMRRCTDDGHLQSCRLTAGCPAWDAGMDCSGDLVCRDGACVDEGESPDGCEDECALFGESVCADTGTIRTCGEHDDDPCLELGEAVACSAGLTCRSGACQLSCVDACPTAGERVCDLPSGERAYRECALVGECLAWGAVLECPSGERCDGGQCVPEMAMCTDDCTTVGDSCQSDAVSRCGQLDGDPCLDRSIVTVCTDPLAPCVDGACTPTTAPAVVIQEIVYDASGADGDPGNGLFVELAGPAGTPLAGFELIGINGSDGDPYAVIELTGAISAAGTYVVAHPQGRGDLVAVAQQTAAAVDFQNGSSASHPAADAVQLRFGSEVVDALGYGAQGANQYGEGSVAADASGDDESLARTAGDTGDNAMDFAVGDPTPGVP